MDVTLSPETEAMVRQKVADGRFASADEVIEAAVTLLEAHDRFERLRASLIEAEEQMRAGKTLEWTTELRQRLRAEAAEMVRQGIPPDPDVCP